MGDNRQQQKTARPPLDFKEVKLVSDPVSKLAIRLMMAETEAGLPQFRRETGEVNDQGHFYRGHRVFREINNGRVSIRGTNFQVFEALWSAVEDFVIKTLQARVDEQDAQRQSQGGHQRPGLKTLSKQDRAKRATGT